MVVADAATAYFIRGLGERAVEARPLLPGLSMVTAGEPNDTALPRVARHLPRFAAANPPDPPDWGTWPALLADGDGPVEAALDVPETRGFGTASAALLAVSATQRIFLFAGGRPSIAGFQTISMP
jgi:hypothetical protein